VDLERDNAVLREVVARQEGVLARQNVNTGGQFCLSVPRLAQTADWRSICTAFFTTLTAEINGGLRALEIEIKSGVRYCDRNAFVLHRTFPDDSTDATKLVLNINARLPRITADAVARAWTIAMEAPPFAVSLNMGLDRWGVAQDSPYAMYSLTDPGDFRSGSWGVTTRV
jgi:hypothetical protein